MTRNERKAGICESPQTISSTSVFDVTHDLVIRHHTYIDSIQCFVVMKSGISVTREATTHDRAEDVGVTLYRNVGTGRIEGCENVPGRIDFNRLRSARGRGADPKKLQMANPTRVWITRRGCLDQRWETRVIS